jgi:3-oxoacyl-[acyl-carrier protein] reductase
MTMELALAGRSALVTGASSGIGRGIALALGLEGVRVAAHGRSRERLATLAQEITSGGGPPPTLISRDLLDRDAPSYVAGEAGAALGSIDILVNNAGAGRPLSPDASEDDWDEAMTLNFTRHRQLAARVVPSMRAAGWGRIVNITGKSESAKGVDGAHCAKAAMHAWAKGMSRDLGPDGVTVNCIAPGKITSAQILARYSPEFRAREAAEDIPLRRYGQPRDIATLVCFLASPLADYITGTVIPVDGGLRRYQF